MKGKEKRFKPRSHGARPMAEASLRIDPVAEEKRITSFIADTVSRAGAGGVVLGLSGGIDSAVTCALCARALGRERVLGLLMPSESTPEGDTSDARDLASSLGIDTREVGVSKIVDQVLLGVGTSGTRIARANVQARARMTVLYFFANSLGRLVAGTGDRSELEIGFFTKHGDGGVDLLPLGHLYKTQVRELAEHLEIPAAIRAKPPSPRLWQGHVATDEIPASYEKLDLILHAVLDLRFSPAKAAATSGVDLSVVKETLEMISKAAHKRALPPVPGRPEQARKPRENRYGYT